MFNKLSKYLDINDHKWSTTNRVLKSHRSKTGLACCSLIYWYKQCVTVHHVSKCMSCHKAILEITGRAHFFMIAHIYYSRRASETFELSMCCGSLMTTYITLLAKLVEHSLVHWYQQCVTLHHVPKCMSCHKAIVVITGRACCFHDTIYIMSVLLLWDLSTLCVMDHLWPLILHSLFSLLSTL